MRTTTKILLAALAACTLAACTQTSAPETNNASASAVQTPKKILVTYYSHSGHTEAVAKQIAAATGGTLFEITTSHKYPENYNQMTAQAKKEIQTGFRPEITSRPENWETYDMVFVGSPNWWGTLSPVVSSFLEKQDFSGKTVVPFFTNGGGGMQNCERNMKKQLPGVTFAQAATFPGKSSGADETALHHWLGQLGFAK